MSTDGGSEETKFHANGHLSSQRGAKFHVDPRLRFLLISCDKTIEVLSQQIKRAAAS